MTHEQQSVQIGETSQGDKLKSKVGMNLMTIAMQYASEGSPYAPMANEISKNFNIFRKFDIWNEQRGKKK